MKRRDRAGIMAEILSLCTCPQSKTRIMRKANLTWTLASRYLEELQEGALLECHHSQIRYATTRKGLAFLEKWEKCAALLGAHR